MSNTSKLFGVVAIRNELSFSLSFNDDGTIVFKTLSPVWSNTGLTFVHWLLLFLLLFVIINCYGNNSVSDKTTISFNILWEFPCFYARKSFKTKRRTCKNFTKVLPAYPTHAACWRRSPRLRSVPLFNV